VNESVNQSLLGKSITLFENIKLEEKIKELQQNLASLPSSFNRPKSKSNHMSQPYQIAHQKSVESTDRYRHDFQGSGVG
jgi:hypothetical protein